MAKAGEIRAEASKLDDARAELCKALTVLGVFPSQIDHLVRKLDAYVDAKIANTTLKRY